MGFLQPTRDQKPTEHTASAANAVVPSSSTSRSAADPSTPTSTCTSSAGGGDLTEETKIIGPNIPVAGVVAGNGEKDGALSSSTDAGAAITTKEEDTGVDSDSSGNVVKSEDEKAGAEDEDESKFPKGFALAILTFGLCMATFVVSIRRP